MNNLKELTQTQKRLIFHWLRIVLVSEIILFLFKQHLSLIFFLIAVLFLIGLFLRIFKLYPGRPESLILDSSAVVISLLIAAAYKAFLISLAFAMSIAPIIILPHIIYIIRAEL
ncbi:MAG: hypothetical protein ABH954_04585 [Candidatus Omnitrophota bacterium]